MITERQGEILNGIVQEYIKGAEPVSSKILEREHKFGICPATIRNEMQRLTQKGYLYQPHTSAGRIPTDQGYRFFVDKILEEEIEDLAKDLEMTWNVRGITKFLARESSNLVLGYLASEKILWKEGWGEILQEPEFTQPGFVLKFAQIIDDFEENIEELFLPEIQIYIGRENPFSKTKDFSIITSGVFTILGPKRMDYNKNINLLSSAIKWLEKI